MLNWECLELLNVNQKTTFTRKTKKFQLPATDSKFKEQTNKKWLIFLKKFF